MDAAIVTGAAPLANATSKAAVRGLPDAAPVSGAAIPLCGDG